MADIDPFASATTLRAALAAGRVSAAELADRYIHRIEQYDGRLNAVVVRDLERARQQARAADLAIARGEARALLGLPITLKESINVAGLGTTCGVPEWKGYVSAHDAPAAARLRAAGTVLLGKTNVPPVLADWQSANPVYGRTSNPWDLARTPGGRHRETTSCGTAGARLIAPPGAPFSVTGMCCSRPQSTCSRTRISIAPGPPTTATSP
jgi:amidase